ncbi:chaperone NapD [Ruegeria atlantica]|jgi:nitrate reductase NapD|uniref:Chaperone NapD n=1 Tax=Ruegeria atlantica TaxID=81569 RepID=A0A0P1EBM8_9RHOB|nr:chaperone NapD [Ruegeria atlantica]CUH46907.1 assembly protein for periplasmic nitrate reductase [Ruegeria atlantica]
MNICGCLAHVAPDHTSAAARVMKGTPGVEIHAETEDGRFVVVVEDTPTRLASETIMDLHQIPGVISLTLTYHHFEDLADAHPQPDAPSPTTSRRPTQ